MSDQKNNQELQMPFGAALFCMLFLLGSMVASMLWLDIPIHIDLLLSIGVTLLVAYLCNGHQWKPLSDAIDYGGKICIQPTIIMMTIGCVVASWIACGTVPMIIYWGLKLINPSVFLLTSCLITAIVAIPIGSSWSAAGTIGVALMGIGMGLGVNPAMTAGAVVSGAYLGDKMSPMSDTTNLAPAVAEADLFDHIKSMMYTTGPAFVITLIVYGLLGLQYDASSVDSEMVTMMTAAIQGNFHMNILLLLPAVVVIVMAVCKCPSIPTLMVSTLVAVVLAMLVQGQSLSGILNILNSGFSIDTALPEFNRLVNRGGLQSMLWTAALGILGMLYGSIMEKAGLLEALLSKMAPLVKSTGGHAAADGNSISDLGNRGGRQNVYRRVQEEKPPAPDPLPYLGGLRHDHQPSGSVVSVRRLYGGHLGGLHHVVSALCHVLLAVPCTGHCIWLYRQILLEDRRKVQPESLPAQHIDGSVLINSLR